MLMYFSLHCIPKKLLMSHFPMPLPLLTSLLDDGCVVYAPNVLLFSTTVCQTGMRIFNPCLMFT